MAAARAPTSVLGILTRSTLGSGAAPDAGGLQGSAQGPKGGHGQGLGQMQRWQEGGLERLPRDPPAVQAQTAGAQLHPGAAGSAVSE